jgi:hypothetical protein
MKVSKQNILANHSSYPKILEAYTLELSSTGKVNAKRFHETVIAKEIPGYALQSWYSFLRRFSTEAGLLPLQPAEGKDLGRVDDAQMGLVKTLLTNSEATQAAVAHALNISATALKDIMEHPELIPAKDRAELFLKVMKAQDSRVKAIGGMRADNREQERFERMQSSAAYA